MGGWVGGWVGRSVGRSYLWEMGVLSSSIVYLEFLEHGQ